MTTRKRDSDRMAATLEPWSAQIVDLQAKVRSASGKQQAWIGRPVAALRQQRTEYAEQMRKTRDTSEAVFRNMRQSAERMAAEFRKTYVQAAGRFAR
jgi:hypothetical protein